MAYKEKEIVKVQWTSGEAAKVVGTTITTIHSWAREFGIVSASKKRGKLRDKRFGSKQIRQFRKIKELTDSKLYTREGIKEKLQAFCNKNSSLREEPVTRFRRR